MDEPLCLQSRRPRFDRPPPSHKTHGQRQAATWVTAAMLTERSNGARSGVTLLAGILILVGGVTATGGLTMRAIVRSVSHPDGPSDSTLVRQTSRAALGERIIGFVRAHPTLSCAVIAIAAAIGAMVRAETTLVSALPWGAAEAVAVVGGYALLGRRIGVCDRASTVPAFH